MSRAVPASIRRDRAASLAVLALGIPQLLGCAPGAGTGAGVTTVSLPRGPASDAATIILDARQDEPLDALLADLPVPSAPVREVVDRVRDLGPWTVTTSTGDATHLDVALSSERSEDLVMQVSTDDAGRLAVLSFGPAVARTRAPTTSAEIDVQLARVSDRATISVSSAEDGRCTPRRTIGAPDGTVLPLGSVSKLLVLSATLRAVSGGSLTWHDRLVLEPELRTWASPSLEGLGDGTTITVSDSVEAMMTTSDSTATDLLIDRLGRSALAAERERLGITGSGAPHWTGKELFALGWGDDPWPVGTQAEGPELEERLRLVRSSLSGPAPATTSVVRWPDGLDWFATPAELCTLAASVADRLDEIPHGLLDALAAAAQPPGEPSSWTSQEPVPGPEGPLPVLTKLGGTAGVVAGLWLLRVDGELRIVTLQAASAEAHVVGDVVGLQGLAARALALEFP